MYRERRGLLDIGISLFLIGLAVKVALTLGGALLDPLASIAIGVGIVLAIIGLVVPGKR